jgi:hypothetical protein
MLFKKCPCDWANLSRSPRSWWMRLFRSRRLYFCSNCMCRIFAVQAQIEETEGWRSRAMTPFQSTFVIEKQAQ